MLLFNSESLNLKRWSFEILQHPEQRDISISDLYGQMLLLFVDMFCWHSLW